MTPAIFFIGNWSLAHESSVVGYLAGSIYSYITIAGMELRTLA